MEIFSAWVALASLVFVTGVLVAVAVSAITLFLLR